MQAQAETPFSLMIECIMIHIIYEILREAGLRVPKPLGHAVSIVGGLVIGEAAVQSGLGMPSNINGYCANGNFFLCSSKSV